MQGRLAKEKSKTRRKAKIQKGRKQMNEEKTK
jgi:hypothetical protein